MSSGQLFPGEMVMSVQVLESKRHEAISAFVGCWQQGERTNATEFLSRRNDFPKGKSLVLDLALEEFCQRRATGETVLPSTFCDAFPVYRRSIKRMLEVHVHLSEHQLLPKNAPQIQWPACGERFLEFDLLEGLGRGAFARVYLARQENFGGRLVALKVAWNGAGEVKTLGRLSHTNIAPAYSLSADAESGLTAVCMPFLGRATLTDLLDAAFVSLESPTSAEIILRVAEDADAPPVGNDTALSEQQLSPEATYVEGIAHLVRQLAEALACVHAAGFLHRDLKPSNVLLTPGGVPMLLDFNLSVDATDKNAAVGGTLPYMPPELLRWVRGERTSETVLNDPRTDIFSLGVILYELLTGVLPFGDPEPGLSMNDGAWQLLTAQADGAPSAASRNTLVPPAIDQIIARCLASDPTRRYAQAGDLARDLRNYLSPASRRSRWLYRNRRAFLSGAVACCLAGGAWGTWYALQSSSRLSELEQGYRDFDLGNYKSAIGCFERHLEQQPDDPEVLFAIGQAHRALGDLDSSFRAYVQAEQHSSAGEVLTCLAYCLAKSGSYPSSTARSKEALVAGYETAAVHNNLAWTLSKTGSVTQAKVHCDRAILLDANLYATRHLRIQLAIRSSLKNRSTPDAEALEDVAKALELGPPTTQLLADAAAIYALAAPDNPQNLQLAEKLLSQALESGLPVSRVQSDFIFAEVRQAPQIQRLLTPATGVPPQTLAELIVPPPLEARLKKK